MFVNNLKEFHSVVIIAKIKGEWKYIFAEMNIIELDCKIYHSLRLPQPDAQVHLDLHFSLCKILAHLPKQNILLLKYRMS